MKKEAIFLILPVILAANVFADTTIPVKKKAEQYFEKANELLKRMDYEGAIAEYGKVINLASGSKAAQDAQYWIGQSQFRAGQFDAAQATFAKLIEQYPSSTIIPVTKLMVERVQRVKKTEAIRASMSDTAAKGYIIDPDTGVKYTKAATFTGKNDVIKRNWRLNLSPNGKFLLCGKVVVPIDGSAPFDLVDTFGDRGVWSPDGTKVAFYSGDAICSIPVSPQTGRPTGPVRKLLEGPYRDQPLVSWSPDGQRLAFVRDDSDIIWTLSVTDGSLTKIQGGTFHGAKWSPDGKTILYAVGEGGGERQSLCTISVDGKASRKVIAPLGSSVLRTPVQGWYWSPDGKWILYRRFGGSIHLLNLNDNQELGTKSPFEVGDFFSWSPDGKKMLFYRESYDWRYELRVVSASGGQSVALGVPTNTWPEHQWSSDSKTILVAGYKDERYGVWLSPLSGGDPVLLEVDVSIDGKPLFVAVSPTGQMLAFVIDRGDGIRDLYVVPVSLKDACSTGPVVKVFEGWHPRYASDNSYEEASWSPDGTRLAVIHNNEIWIASSNGSKPVQLTHDIGAFYPGWSPDGTMVDYMAWTKQDPEGSVYVIPSRGGNPTKIRATEYCRRVWSPDSKKIAVVSKDSISTVTVAEGQIQEIAKLKDVDLNLVYSLDWSPDGKYIACDGRNEKRENRPVILIPVEGGEPTILAADDNGYKEQLKWSPDGKWIGYRSGGEVKVRPEGILWEADFDEIVKKASR